MQYIVYVHLHIYIYTYMYICISLSLSLSPPHSLPSSLPLSLSLRPSASSAPSRRMQRLDPCAVRFSASSRTDGSLPRGAGLRARVATAFGTYLVGSLNILSEELLSYRFATKSCSLFVVTVRCFGAGQLLDSIRQQLLRVDRSTAQCFRFMQIIT